MIEVDVRATADGRCVVIHDATVDRTTDGAGVVAEMSYERLRAFDAGYRFSRDGGATFPFRDRDVRIPSFDETLESLPETRFIVEVKTGDAQKPLLEAIARAGASSRVILGGMYDRDRDLFGDYDGPISMSGDQLRRFLYAHKLGLRPRVAADGVFASERHGRVRIVTPRFVRAMHRQNVPVHVWTINDEADMERLFDWGVDGILTDRPDRLRKVIDARAGKREDVP